MVMETTTAAALSSSPLVTCVSCCVQLEMPYIRCAECPLTSADLCLRCFSRGAETSSHRSEHRYQVIRNDFPLFDPTWTAEQEVTLLDALLEYGFGNWADIAKEMRTKSKSDCERHYSVFYLQNATPELPVMAEAEATSQAAPVIYKLSDDPPRCADGSQAQYEMAGYMAARGDFTVEHDNYAELHLSAIDFESLDESDVEDKDFHKKLNLAVIAVYQNVLLERRRRKRIIRKYGLINIRKLAMRYQLFSRSVGPLCLDAMRSLQRLVSQLEFDKFTESLHYEFQLRQQIGELQEYRANGITDLALVGVYNAMRVRRSMERNRRGLFTDALSKHEMESACHSFQLLCDTPDRGRLPNPIRKSAPPLNIVSMPGYEKLLDVEKQLCSEVRLVPEAFLEFKRLLVAECLKLGGLKLAQARPLIKIDVNKTRKIYNYLLENEHIYCIP